MKLVRKPEQVRKWLEPSEAFDYKLYVAVMNTSVLGRNLFKLAQTRTETEGNVYLWTIMGNTDCGLKNCELYDSLESALDHALRMQLGEHGIVWEFNDFADFMKNSGVVREALR